MLLSILTLNLVFCITSADAKSLPKQGLEDLVENLEFRLRDVETRMQGEKEKLELTLPLIAITLGWSAKTVP